MLLSTFPASIKKKWKRKVKWYVKIQFANIAQCSCLIVCPLGVMLQNENKLDEMTIIMERFMKLVPTLPKMETLSLPDGKCIEYDDTRFAKVILGGDQLTVARVRGTQALRKTEDRLEGIAPVTEDWHARMTLVRLMIC